MSLQGNTFFRFIAVYYLLLSLFFTFKGSARNMPPNILRAIDSLNTIIDKSESHDTSIVIASLELSDIYSVYKFDTLHFLNKKVLNIVIPLLKENHNPKVERSLLRSKACAMYNLGISCFEVCDFKTEMNYYLASLGLFRELGYLKGVGINFKAIGDLSIWLGDFPKALNYLNKSLLLFEHIENKRWTVEVLNSIGLTYLKQGQYEKGLQYLKRCESQIEEGFNKTLTSDIYNNIGLCYDGLESFDSAIKYQNKGLKINEEINDPHMIGRSLNNIAFSYARQGKFNEGIVYMKKALTLGKEQGSKLTITNSAWLIGKTNMRLGNLGEAELFFKSSLDAALKLGYPESISRVSQSLSELYEKKNDHKRALKMQKLHNRMEDSLRNETTQKAIHQREIQYQLDKETQALRLQKKTTKLRTAQLKLSILLYGLLLVTLIGVVIVLFRYKRKKYENELNLLRQLELEQKDKTSMISSIPVRVGSNVKLIDPKDVYFFNAKDKFVFLNLWDNSYIVNYTLKKLEDSLPNGFLRIHKSYIINIRQIKEIKSSYNTKIIITLKDKSETTIPSGVAYAENVKQLKESINKTRRNYS